MRLVFLSMGFMCLSSFSVSSFLWGDCCSFGSNFGFVICRVSLGWKVGDGVGIWSGFYVGWRSCEGLDFIFFFRCVG